MLSRSPFDGAPADFRCSVVGLLSKRLSPSLTQARLRSGPFAPRSLPASQLLWACPTPAGTNHRLFIPCSCLRPCGPLRFLDRSFHARCPLSPRTARRLLLPVASSPVPGFILFGGLATVILCNEAETGSLALRLACSPCKASPVGSLPLTLARLLAKRAIYKISSFQNIRSARLILALPEAQSSQSSESF